MTKGAANAIEPTWSPEGTKLAYAYGVPSGKKTIMVVSSNGTGAHELIDSGDDQTDPAWRP